MTDVAIYLAAFAALLGSFALFFLFRVLYHAYCDFKAARRSQSHSARTRARYVHAKAHLIKVSQLIAIVLLLLSFVAGGFVFAPDDPFLLATRRTGFMVIMVLAVSIAYQMDVTRRRIDQILGEIEENHRNRGYVE